MGRRAVYPHGWTVSKWKWSSSFPTGAEPSLPVCAVGLCSPQKKNKTWRPHQHLLCSHVSGRVCCALPWKVLSRQPPGWLAVVVHVHSAAAQHLMGLWPQANRKLAGPGLLTGLLAPACILAFQARGPFSPPVLAEGTLQGCAAVQGLPFIFHSPDHMADFLCNFWAQVSQATIPPPSLCL